MGKKTALSLAALLATALISTSAIAAKPADKGAPEGKGKPTKVDGVITKPNGEIINTGKSDTDPGPSPSA